MIQTKLKVQIAFGYTLLIVLFTAVIRIVYEEKQKKSLLETEDAHWQENYRQRSRTFLALLDLASTGELIAGWTQEDYLLYEKKRENVMASLQKLKMIQSDTVQQMYIDSVCSLLLVKEKHLMTVMQMLETTPDAGEIVHRKIPAILLPTGQQTTPSNKVETGQVAKKGRKGLLGLFAKKESKSAYALQREKEQIERDNKKRQVIKPAVTSATLLQLEKEISDSSRWHREKLETVIDSLRKSNRGLNEKLTALIQNFEEKETQQLAEKLAYMQKERNCSFRLAAGMTLSGLILVIILYIIIHRYVNRQYRYRRRLEASNKENIELLTTRKNMMLSIAHDLRAPLATIKGCAELLPGEEEKSRKDEYAENILHSSDYMVGLVNTLIEFYLLDTGRNKPSLSIFRLETLFNEIAQNYGSLAEKKKLRLTTDFSGLDVVVSSDRSQLQQILNNLLSNAIKFTRQGEIRLQAEYRNKELHFLVQDTGTGMTEEETARIFAAFERLDNARNLPGFGLGLAIASRLVSGMQGTLTVKSKPGEGSTFTAFLPLPEADESTRIDETRLATDYHLDELNVLVIDDDRIQLNITKEMLNRNGMRCDCCQTSRELVTRLRSQRYDLLLTDIQMPETDGYGILELLRASNMENAKAIPVIAVTARVDDDNEYLSGDFSGCIHKPFSMEELINTVAQVIGEKDKKEYAPDFSLILSGEDNREEMLGLFIEESRKDLATLTAALDRKDKETAASILHKNLPLWETVRLDFPLSHLRELVTGHAAEWTEGQYKEIREIIRAVEKLIAYAEKIREESL